MKDIKSLRFMSLCIVILLLVLQCTNSAYSAAKGWKEGDTYKWSVYSIESMGCDQDGQRAISNVTMESIQQQTIHRINETAQTINVSSLFIFDINNPKLNYNEYSYNASYFGANFGSLIDGDFFLEKDTGKFIVANLHVGIFGFYGPVRNFVDPQWDIINTEFKKVFNTSNIVGTARNLSSDDYRDPYLFYDFTLADILGNVTSYKLMGQDNWDDGLAKITNSTRSWSLELDVTNMARQSEWDYVTGFYYSATFDLYTYKTEFSFNNDGIAESVKSEQETKLTINAITCTTKTVSEKKLGGLPASVGGVPSFELISAIVLLGTLTLIVKRNRR
ncbi:MAG: hypothetical protein ACXAC7_13620 [Candidatus Hodarchaeales archaeon]|jgi:hypothetical protein